MKRKPTHINSKPYRFQISFYLDWPTKSILATISISPSTLGINTWMPCLSRLRVRVRVHTLHAFIHWCGFLPIKCSSYSSPSSPSRSSFVQYQPYPISWNPIVGFQMPSFSHSFCSLNLVLYRNESNGLINNWLPDSIEWFIDQCISIHLSDRISISINSYR